MTRSKKVVDRDRGWRAVKQLAAEIAARKPQVVVGVTGKAAVAQHAGSQSTVVDIAQRHELGIGVPQRSFIRATVDANAGPYRDQLRKAIRSTVLYTAAHGGRFSPKQSVSLKRFGLKVEGDIKKYIATGIAPPLAASTLKRKGNKTTALILTGQMRASITSEVRAR